VNRLLIAACAVAAFAATWLHLEASETRAVRGRPGAVAAAATQADRTGQEPIALPASAFVGEVRGPVANVDELIAVLDADLGEEGVPVDRLALEAALRADPELRRALGLP